MMAKRTREQTLLSTKSNTRNTPQHWRLDGPSSVTSTMKLIMEESIEL